ncbi:UNVERIFIED_CONTAM: hypothetical protein FKN15_018769 [Acipenser sinensis]
MPGVPRGGAFPCPASTGSSPPRAALLLLSLFLLLLPASAGSYKQGDPVTLYVNKVGPYHNPQETYHYYTLPVCRPREVRHKSLSLGEVLDGDRMAESLYEVDILKEAIEELYYFEFVLDEIPIWGFVGYMEESGFLPHSHKAVKVDAQISTRTVRRTRSHNSDVTDAQTVDMTISRKRENERASEKEERGGRGSIKVENLQQSLLGRYPPIAMKTGKQDETLETSKLDPRFSRILPNPESGSGGPTTRSEEPRLPRTPFLKDSRRSRTTIHPEQLDFLYGCYFRDPNPVKRDFERISQWRAKVEDNEAPVDMTISRKRENERASEKEERGGGGGGGRGSIKVENLQQSLLGRYPPIAMKTGKQDETLETSKLDPRFSRILPNPESGSGGPTTRSEEPRLPRTPFLKDSRRSRTTIHPEQLDFLYGCYFRDPNPVKRDFERISQWVCLEKRVVQIWFQNMRARERKGEVRFFSDGTLAAVGKPLIRFTWPPAPLDELPSPEQTGLDSPGVLDRKVAPVKIESEDGGAACCFESVGSLKKIKQEEGEEGGEGEGEEGKSRSLAVMKPRHNINNNSLSRNNNINNKNEGSNRSSNVVIVANNNSLPEAWKIAKQPGFQTDLSASCGLPKESARERKDSASERLSEDLKPEPLRPQQPGPSSSSPSSSYLTRSQAHREGPARKKRRREEEEEEEEGYPEETEHHDALTRPESDLLQAQKQKRRARTHLSKQQVRVMQACFKRCRTPTAHECDVLGRELGLPLKVVQIWFQNSRAREKRLTSSPVATHQNQGQDGPPRMDFRSLEERRRGEALWSKCQLCDYRFGEQSSSSRAHLFSRAHLQRLKQAEAGQPQELTPFPPAKPASPGQLPGHAVFMMKRHR